MSESKKSEELRTINILLGSVLIVIAVMVLTFSYLALITLFLMISIGILILGAAWVINASKNKTFETEIKVLKFVTGFSAILFGITTLIMAIVNPSAFLDLLIILFAISLFIVGIVRFARGYLAKEFPNWFRLLIISVGILTIVFSILILVNLELGYLFLIFLIAFILLFNGIARLVLGIVNP